MLTKAQIRAVVRLRDAKSRAALQRFVVEGDKIVRETLAAGWPMIGLFATEEWAAALPVALRSALSGMTIVSERELKALSLQTTPHGALAIVERTSDDIDWDDVFSDTVVALDAVQDPGNMGTLLRIAAWFGVRYVLASPDTVDVTNPKVVQASMGAFLRVRVHEVELRPALAAAREAGVPAFAMAVAGTSLYDAESLPSRGVFLLGNESRGVAADLLACVDHVVSIPAWRGPGWGCDSLNVASAGAILCAEIRRRSARLAPPDVRGTSSAVEYNAPTTSRGGI